MTNYSDRVVYTTDVSIEHSTCLGFYNRHKDLCFMLIGHDEERDLYILSDECVLDSFEDWFDLEDVLKFVGMEKEYYGDLSTDEQKCRFSSDVYAYYGSQASSYEELTEKEFFAKMKRLGIISSGSLSTDLLRHGILYSVFTGYGAPTGRTNVGTKPKNDTVYDRVVPMIDGAYDIGGVYWGLPLGANDVLRVAYTKDLKYIEFYRSCTALHKQGKTYQRKTKIEYQMYSNYGYGWEHETTEESYEALKEQIKTYKENCPEGRYKMVFKRVKIED